ncbi:hypothetical protein KDA_62120 [Dictyobacter alpinus]|uniref:Peroxiredoxin n=1 Tax=Dictyobacter alpinus TaxID=2014873 RepID=A0A402BH21_9CHLR|nr:OsmC family protein [Dictyobacter alpinus]GCE30728.1 hypothetical protein KDA_62120 [Dictyobacter alpinus]
MHMQMNVQAKLDSALRFNIDTGTGHSLILDTDEPDSGEESAGPCPMELLLSALAGCAGIEIMTILRKMKQDIHDYAIEAHGEKVPQPPHIFHTITVEHHFTGSNIHADAIQRAISLVEKRYCSVGLMIDQTTQITHTFSIQNM